MFNNIIENNILLICTTVTQYSPGTIFPDAPHRYHLKTVLAEKTSHPAYFEGQNPFKIFNIEYRKYRIGHKFVKCLPKFHIKRQNESHNLRNSKKHAANIHTGLVCGPSKVPGWGKREGYYYGEGVETHVWRCL